MPYEPHVVNGYKNYAGGLKTLGPIKDEVLAAFD